MNFRGWTAPASAAALLCLAAPSPAQPPAPPQVRLPKAGEPLVLDAGRQKIRVVLVADGLVGPWDIDFVPDGDTLLVNESDGRMRIVEHGQLRPEAVWEAPAPEGNDVLHGLAVHPDFERTRFVYASYTKGREQDDAVTLAIARGRLEGGMLVDVRDVFVADAWETARNATAGRMLFGPDDTLYVTVGDRDRLCCGPQDDNSIRIKSQQLGNHVGKILRLTDDGGVPPDNPFVDTPGAKPEIFTYGNRNGYGLAFHPETGELWEVEIGPLGGDELNILRAGANYGWPLVSMGRNYTGTFVSEQPWFREGMEMPRMFWVPQISPSGLTFYTGDAFPDWQGSAFIGSLNGLQMQRLAFDQPGQAERREPLLAELGVRFRDVEQGPDGFLYVTTEVRYGSGQPDGTVLRIEPAG